MRMEHKTDDKLFVDYTGNKLWIYPPGEQPREMEVFVAIRGYSLDLCENRREPVQRGLYPSLRELPITISAAFQKLSFPIT